MIDGNVPMTRHEFNDRYYAFVSDKDGATAEANKINQAGGVDGDFIVPVSFGYLGWGIITLTALIELAGIGVIGNDIG